MDAGEGSAGDAEGDVQGVVGEEGEQTVIGNFSTQGQASAGQKGIQGLGSVRGIASNIGKQISRGQEGIPQGLKPTCLSEFERAKAKALAYLEAKAMIRQALPDRD